MANAARSDSQRSALHRASHRTASNAPLRNGKQKTILSLHHEYFRQNKRAFQPYLPRTLALPTEYSDEARPLLRTSEEGPLKQGKWSAPATQPTLKYPPESRPSLPLSGPFYFKISHLPLHGKRSARRAGAAGKSPSIPNKTEKELKDF